MMVWAKRRFAFAAFAPYQGIMEKLVKADAARYQEFIMVSVKADGPGENDYYVGVPDKALLTAFDGFIEVSESELPKEIDTILIADATKEPFTRRFKFRNRRLGR